MGTNAALSLSNNNSGGAGDSAVPIYSGVGVLLLQGSSTMADLTVAPTRARQGLKVSAKGSANERVQVVNG